MPTWDSFAAFSRELYGLEGELTVTEKKKITRAQGVAAQKIVADAARADLGGDRAFSGWRRGAPIPLDTRLRNAGDGNTLMIPTRAGAGVATVAEFGRNAALGPRMTGPRLTKTGRVSRRRARRYNGRTQPKYTATDAAKVMERELPKIADKAVLVVTRKRFTVT